MDKFEDSLQIAAIFFGDDTIHRANETCKCITVVMENGQMASVPWFEVESFDGTIQRWNGALLQGVEMFK